MASGFRGSTEQNENNTLKDLDMIRFKATLVSIGLNRKSGKLLGPRQEGKKICAGKEVDAYPVFGFSSVCSNSKSISF